ncbi:four-carbon acid sugar kinase family protein [uncultured Paracoccus sp.]|uniref:four-carbon acid sugar kinase family protein n=1 Tax=uncultured Paracoccus sp. TaxID=189685 RepID=UPI00261E5942|nr:four-carbon acid sugar kinase family protein [uncultured Paracoccus sp.]
MTHRVLIIADDLTGALDSGSAFAMRGHATRVLLDAAGLPAALADPDLQVIAIATGTREVPVAEAAQTVHRIAETAAGFDGILFKKIDSRMKGHIAAELAALRGVFPLPVLAVPAIPRLGRLVVDGCVTGAGVETRIPIAPRLGIAARIPDTTSDAQIDAVLPGALDQAIHAGAAGLAEALARALPPGHATGPIDLPLPLLMAIGSRDPVTLAQIAALETAPITAPNGAVPTLPVADLSLVQMTAGVEPVSPAEAAENFATGIARELRRNPPRSLFACGGETAHAILRQLGTTTLDLLGEILPGIPVARTIDGKRTVITKSGGFGGPDALRQLTGKFVK